MFTARYDTFEDEKEINAMIEKLQSKTREYMSRPDAWEVPSLNSEQSVFSKF